MKAYYFANKDEKLRYNDNRLIVVGETHSVSLKDKPLKLCNWGLHASTKALDALSYAPGSILYIVELSGEILIGEDKVCAEHRKYLYKIDAEDLLREFARKQALINIDKIYPYITETEKETILKYLEGRDLSESAAWAAAESAARSAQYAARSAARSAVRSAARSAAESAAQYAWAAAEAAAESATQSAAKSAARSAARSAAQYATKSAAKSATQSANKILEEMIAIECKGI